MKKSRFSEAQIVGFLKEVEMGAKVDETCRKHGISEPPTDVIPTGVSLITFSGGVTDLMAMTVQDLIEQVETGVLPIRLGPFFHLDQVSLAHALMEQTSVRGENRGVDQQRFSSRCPWGNSPELTAISEAISLNCAHRRMATHRGLAGHQKRSSSDPIPTVSPLPANVRLTSGDPYTTST